MVLFTGLMWGMTRQLEHTVTHLTVGDFQIHHEDYLAELSLYDTIDSYQEIHDRLATAGIHVAPRWYGYGLVANDRTKKSAGVHVQAVDLEQEQLVTDLHLPKYLEQGHYLSGAVKTIPREKPGRRRLEGLDAALGIDFAADEMELEAEEEESLVVEEIVLGKKVARILRAEIGDQLVLVTTGRDGSIGNELLRVVGILDNIGESFDRTRVVVGKRAFTRLFSFPENVTHELALRTSQLTTKQEVQTLLKGSLSPSIELRSWREVMPLIADVVTMMNVSTMILTFIIYMAAALVVLNAVLMMVFERLREFGVMKAIGTKPLQLVGLILLETIMLTLIASGFGWSLAYPLNLWLVHRGLDMGPFAPNGFDFSGTTIDPLMRSVSDLEIFLQPTLLLFLITICSALYPAWKAARIIPVKAIYSR